MSSFGAWVATGLIVVGAAAGSGLVGSPALAQYDGYRYRAPDPDDDYVRPRRRYLDDDDGPSRRDRYESPRPRYDDEYERRRRRDERSYDERDYRRPAERSYDPGPARPVNPQARGSFVQTCSNIQQDGYYLEARCRRLDGGYSLSRIDVRSCRSIANRDGQLACE